jgi:glutamate synthase domain-containing protein 2
MLAHGADVCNSARSMMFALGCIQALKCNSNNCPTGITTQRPDLESGLDVKSKSIRVANYHEATIHSALEIIAALGCNTPRDVTPDLLFRRTAVNGFGVESYADLQVSAEC